MPRLSRESLEGFTVIEMLIVVTVVVMLAAMVLNSLGNARERGRDARRVADMKTVETALDLYNAKNGNYPTMSTTDFGKNFTDMLNKLKSDGDLNTDIQDPSFDVDKSNRYYEYVYFADNSCGKGHAYELGIHKTGGSIKNPGIGTHSQNIIYTDKSTPNWEVFSCE